MSADEIVDIERVIGGLSKVALPSMGGLGSGAAALEVGSVAELLDSQFEFGLFFACVALALTGVVFSLGLLVQLLASKGTIENMGGSAGSALQSQIASYRFMSLDFSRSLYFALAGVCSTFVFDGILEYSPRGYHEGALSYSFLEIEVGPWADVLEAGLSSAFFLFFFVFFVSAARSLSRVVMQNKGIGS